MDHFPSKVCAQCVCYIHIFDIYPEEIRYGAVEYNIHCFHSAWISPPISPGRIRDKMDQTIERMFNV